MTSNTRRPGFRLWGADSADEPEGSATDQPDEQAAVDAAPSEDSAPESPTAEATPTPASPSPESAGFLASLVGAMRSVAEEAREANLADLRATVDNRVSELERDAAERADDLRRQSDLDIAAIADWQRSEVERIRGEGEARTAARRQQLEQQLGDHQANSEAQVAATRARLAEHEGELASFFSQLGEITDPAAFVAAAERMPRAPELDAGSGTSNGTSATDADASRRTLDMRLAELGVNRAADEPMPTEDAATEATESEAAAPAASPAAVDVPVEGAAEAGRDSQLADRLAELDRQIADTPAATASAADAPDAEEGPTAAPSEAAAPGGASTDSSTSVVVKGLGSFGAITSFKQALERVEGVEGVTLSLGPTGEFVYRASHAPGFDMVAAVRSIEGPSAQVERTDDGLRVSVNRAR